MLESLLLALPFFCVALLYASVGHGGASGYLAVMALLSVEPALLRPTALALNVVVSALGTYAFFRAGHFSGRLFWPLILSAIPCAYLGGSMVIPDEVFRKLLGLALCVGLFRLLIPTSSCVILEKSGGVNGVEQRRLDLASRLPMAVDSLKIMSRWNGRVLFTRRAGFFFNHPLTH